MYQENLLQSLPLYMQWNMLNAYNESIRQQKIMRLYHLQQLQQQQQQFDYYNIKQQTTVMNDYGWNYNNGIYWAQNSYGQVQQNPMEYKPLMVNQEDNGYGNVGLRERIELKNENYYNADLNETMPITPIKKHKENKFFITKKRHRQINNEEKKEIEGNENQRNEMKKEEIVNKEIQSIKTNEVTVIAKPKTIYHGDYEDTKSMGDFMKYNFNYENEYEANRENCTRISSDEFGLMSKDDGRVKDENRQRLPKITWRMNDLDIDDIELKRLLRKLENSWPKKYSYDEELALRIFTMTKYNKELTAKYISSKNFKYLLENLNIEAKNNVSKQK